jgi:AraC-like DNA-binding protein
MATALSTYREFVPPAAVAAYVTCVWEQRIGDLDRPYEQPVFPDGCIDLVAHDVGGFIAGPATAPTVAALPAGSVTVGVRLRPGAAPAVLGVSAHELVDQNVPFDELWSRPGSDLAKRLPEAAGADERRAILTDLVRRRVDSDARIDREIVNASALLAADPTRSLDDLCNATSLSARQLRRRMTDAVGYSPRLLAGVLRFQRFLQTVRHVSADQRDLARLAVEAGYADQPHLTRECRRFSGASPAALLAEEARRLSVGDDGEWPEPSRPATPA